MEIYLRLMSRCPGAHGQDKTFLQDLLAEDEIGSVIFRYLAYCRALLWISSFWFLTLMKPIWGKETDELFHNYMQPMIDTYIGAMKVGRNVLTYDTPALLYCYGSPYSDPSDPLIAATYAMRSLNRRAWVPACRGPSIP